MGWTGTKRPSLSFISSNVTCSSHDIDGQLPICFQQQPLMSQIFNRLDKVDGVKCHFQQYFSYIVAVSFIGGGHRRTRKKNHRSVASHWQTLSHNAVFLALSGSRTHAEVIGTDCISSCNSNYHTIMATTPHKDQYLHK